MLSKHFQPTAVAEVKRYTPVHSMAKVLTLLCHSWRVLFLVLYVLFLTLIVLLL